MSLEDEFDERMTVFSDHKLFKINKKLRKKALALTALEKEDTVRNIYHWLRAEVKYSRGFFIRDHYGHPNRVHKRGRGVCVDQSILYVAMAREAGLESCVAYAQDCKHAVAVVRLDGDPLIVDIASGNYYNRNISDYRPVRD